MVKLSKKYLKIAIVVVKTLTPTCILTGLRLRETDGRGVSGLVNHANVHFVLVGIQSSKKTQNTYGLLDTQSTNSHTKLYLPFPGTY